MIKLLYPFTFLLCINFICVLSTEECPGRGVTVGEAFRKGSIPNDVNINTDELNFVKVTYVNTFGVEREVKCFTNMSVSDTTMEPRISYIANPGKYYSVMMLDLDAPNHATRFTVSPFLHWLVINVLEDELDNGNPIANYIPSDPTEGVHRYVFFVFEQPGIIKQGMILPPERMRFNVLKWMRKYETKPYAGNVFYEINPGEYDPKG